MISIYTRKSFFVLLFLFLLFHPVSALDIAGVSVPDSVEIESTDAVLFLSRTGVQKKLFADIYVEALYLSQNQDNANNILESPGAKSLVLHFIYSEVSAKRLFESWNESFIEELTFEEVESIQARLVPIISQIRCFRKGDVVRLDFLPGIGTNIWLNDVLLSTVEGPDFYGALLRAWLSHSA